MTIFGQKCEYVDYKVIVAGRCKKHSCKIWVHSGHIQDLKCDLATEPTIKSLRNKSHNNL